MFKTRNIYVNTETKNKTFFKPKNYFDAFNLLTDENKVKLQKVNI